MKFEQLASSSKGNLYIVTAENGMRLMIECGMPWKKVLEAMNYDLGNIAGCLISHSHGDHAQACKEVLKSGIDVFASPGTLEALGIADHRRTFSDLHYLSNRGFNVSAYSAVHDAPDPWVFFIRADGQNLLFATDTCKIPHFPKVDFNIVAIECSYDIDVLQHKLDTGKIDQSLATRLLTSHMEVSKTKSYLKNFCNLKHCEEIHLLHLSAGNIVKQKLIDEFETAFFIETKIMGV